MGILGNLAFIIEWISARLPDTIIAVSDHTKRKLLHNLKIKNNIKIVTNGIDITSIKNVKPSQQKSDVIFAGRLLSHKNIDILIQSIHLIKKTKPRITCIIVGKGPEENKLKKLVETLHLQKNIFFYDFLENNSDLYALMKSSKVFAFPSTREGFGLVALEANASGIPVITIDHKDNATMNIIKNGKNGNIIPLNEKALATTIHTYLSENKKSISFDEQITNYDWDKITNSLEQIYLQ